MDRDMYIYFGCASVRGTVYSQIFDCLLYQNPFCGRSMHFYLGAAVKISARVKTEGLICCRNAKKGSTASK